MSLDSIRSVYEHPPLLEADAGDDPLVLFGKWLDEAMNTGMPDPNAMTLATVEPDGTPQARIVLLRGADREGFVFYTNYRSDKARQLEAHPSVSLSFFWAHLSRQVRVVGPAARVPEAMSDAYFASRPRGHQIGAWVSEQSSVIASRQVIEARIAEYEAKFGEGPVPRPPHWGGYRVTPRSFEFWQGQPSRLHDRLRFRLDGGAWTRERLAP